MNPLPEGSAAWNALEAASFAPVLFALLLGSLPLLLPLAFYRWRTIRAGKAP